MTQSPFVHLLRFLVLFPVLVGLVSCSPEKKAPVLTFPHPLWSLNATIYEVNVRQFTPEGTFAALESHLPRLQKMGVKILWLMPVHPIGEKNRKGGLGSYYSVQDYLKVNPEFGTPDDFRSLVRKSHELGMYVIIDWVANHTAWDNPLITEHPDWYKTDSTGKIIPPVADWTDVAALDFSSDSLRSWMTEALKFWIKEYDIDGYRCDVAGMIPVSFWDSAVLRLRQIKPVFMLAEWETPEMHNTAFDATYAWDFHHLMNKIAKGERTPLSIDTLYARDLQKYPPHAFRMLFTSNHDENSWNGTEYERMGDAARAMAVLSFTFPGIPLIYTGQEAAMNKRLRFFDKDTVPWNDYPLEKFYTTLTGLKTNTTLLDAGESGGAFLKIPSTADSAVYAFMRKNDEARMLVILNLSPGEKTFELTGEDFPGQYQDVFSGSEVNLKKGEQMTLSAWDYRVYLLP